MIDAKIIDSEIVVYPQVSGDPVAIAAMAAAQLPATFKGDKGDTGLPGTDGADGAGVTVNNGAVPPPNAINFARKPYVSGSDYIPRVAKIGTPEELKIVNGFLTVKKGFTDTTNLVLLPDMVMNEGISAFRTRYDSFTIITIGNPLDGPAYALWCFGGANINYGIHNGASLVPIVPAAGVPAGADSDILIIEVRRGLTIAGAKMEIRCWLEGGYRPSLPQIEYLHDHADDPHLAEGMLSISTHPDPAFADKRARIQSIKIETAARIQGQAYNRGLWCNRYEAGYNVQRTAAQGSSTRFMVKGHDTVTVNYVVAPGQTQAPVGYLFVDGVTTGESISLAYGSAGLNSVALPYAFDPDRVTFAEVRWSGIYEGDNNWVNGTGVLLESIHGNNPTGRIEPWVDRRPKALFDGDSITAGTNGRMVVYNAGPLAIYGSGDLNHPALLADRWDMQDIRLGYGGSGLGTVGSGGVPKRYDDTAAAGHEFDNSPLMNYMRGRRIDWAAENIKAWFINLGTNDGTLTSEQFRARMKAYIAYGMSQMQSLQRVEPWVPFRGDHETAILQVGSDLNDPRVVVVNAKNWVHGEGFTAPDLAHPNLIGSQQARDARAALGHPLLVAS